MKLVIQIPCLNEEENLPRVLGEIPEQIDGVDERVIAVLDDGSTDKTVEVARRHGADQVLSSPTNLGLARTFARGIDAALALGADVIVNIDGDNQYRAAEIPRLIAPILAGEAHIVIGNRGPGALAHFSAPKRLLQRLGNVVISRLAGMQIPDGVSGFRAYSREGALRINIQSSFSYTLESLLQAALSGERIAFVDIEANETKRPSRLASGVLEFVFKQGMTIVRTLTINRPVWTFSWIGVILAVPGLALGFRFLYHFVQGQGQGYVQSLILTSILIVCSFFSFMLGAAMDVVASNRKILEEQLYLLRLRRYAGSGREDTTPDQPSLEGESVG